MDYSISVGPILWSHYMHYNTPKVLQNFNSLHIVVDQQLAFPGE